MEFALLVLIISP